MPINFRNLQVIKSRDRQLGEALEDAQRYINNISSYMALNSDGSPATPPPINKLEMLAEDGIFSAVITDNNPVYRPINYFLEYSTNSGFNNSHVISLGPSRTHRVALGNQNLHWRAYSQYIMGGPPSAPVLHGNGLQATSVNGGNVSASYSGPAIPISTGSGTSTAPHGGVGAGKTPFSKTINGLAPKL